MGAIRSVVLAACLGACGGSLAPTEGEVKDRASSDGPAASGASSSGSSVASSIACPTTPTLVVPGNPESFAVTDAFIYVQSYSLGGGPQIERVPVGGGASTVVLTGDALSSTLGFALANGSLFYEPSYTPELSLTKTPLASDLVGAPVAATRVSPYAGMAVDASNVWSGQVFTASGIHRWPLDGSPKVVSPLAEGMNVQAITAAPEGAYAALIQVTDQGHTSTGFITHIGLDGSSTTLASKVGEPGAIAADGQYVYYAAMRGDFSTGALFRMAKDGSGLTALTEPSPLTFVLADGSLYFLRDSAVWKLPKSGGSPAKMGAAQTFGGLQVRGATLYWAVAGEHDGVAPGIYAVCR